MQKSKKVFKHKYLIMVAIIILLIAVLYYVKQQNKKISIENISFSEVFDINFTLNNLEKQNINEMLTTLCIEEDSYYGFSSNKTAKVDLYQAYSAANLLMLIPDYDLASIKERLIFLSNANVEQFDFLNLMYYIDICEKLEIQIDYKVLNNELVKYYDEELNLFYLDDEDNSVNIKLIATAMVKNIFKENLSTDLFFPEKGIENVYSKYSFKTQNDVTLYNSGGDILYCISVYKMEDLINKSSLMDWYEYWKEIYESTEIDSQVCAVQYAEYLNIAKIFEPNYSVNKLQEYYDSLTTDTIVGYDELNILYNFMKYVEIENNEEIVSLLRNKIIQVTESKNFVVSDIDVQATVFGVILAKKSGFAINEGKIKTYIKDNYRLSFEPEQIYARTSNLYYNIILDQIINGYEQDYNDEFLQSEVNDILEEMDYDSDSIVADVISTRRIVEIVSDLQMFDVDINLTKSQIKKIKKGFEKALKLDEIYKSFLINDMYIVDRILKLDIVSDEEVIEVYKELSIGGGTCAAKSSDVVPDISSTYQFYVSLSRMDYHTYLDQQQEFINTLKVKDGIYGLDSNNNYGELMTLVYANAIHNAKLGGDKFD